MKKLSILLLALVIGNSLFSQTDSTSTTISSKKVPYESKSIFGSGKLVGGFGALSVKGTSIDNSDVMMMGLKGGFVFGHNLNVGIAGYGFLSPMELSSTDTIEYAGGYGGLYFEPVLWADKVVHLAFPVIVGAGGMGRNISTYGYGNNAYVQDGSGFFVFEPGAVVEFNIVNNVRLDIGGTYRFTYGLSLPEVSSDVLNNWSLEFTVKIGAF